MERVAPEALVPLRIVRTHRIIGVEHPCVDDMHAYCCVRKVSVSRQAQCWIEPQTRQCGPTRAVLGLITPPSAPGNFLPCAPRRPGHHQAWTNFAPGAILPREAWLSFLLQIAFIPAFPSGLVCLRSPSLCIFAICPRGMGGAWSMGTTVDGCTVCSGYVWTAPRIPSLWHRYWVWFLPASFL